MPASICCPRSVPVADVGRRSGAVPQLRNGSSDKVGDDMNADDIFFAAVENLAEIIRQLFQEFLIKRFARSNR